MQGNQAVQAQAELPVARTTNRREHDRFTAKVDVAARNPAAPLRIRTTTTGARVWIDDVEVEAVQ